jgi:uncharacterized protein YeaO (DUF488 family)
MMRRNGMNSSVDTSRNWIKKEMQLTQSSKKAKEQHSVTLLYATKEEKFNNAVALKEFLEEKIQK